MAPTAALIGVYRARNAHLVRAICEPALAQGWTVAWWALDDIPDELAPHTVGSGPGQRLPLLNRILGSLGAPASWLVVSDDDVAFERGDVVALQRVCRRGGLDLAQPARTDTRVDHPITSARPRSRARRTSFVEIGPLFAVGPAWRDRIVPFPEERGMGWGLELDWFELERDGCALGIVDAVRVRHEGTPGGDYDFAGEVRRVHAELAARGLEWSDVQLVRGTWRPWRRTPPWTRA